MTALRLPVALAALFSTAAAVYLAATDAPLGAPAAFVVLSAAALGLVLYSMARAGTALLREPRADEVKVATGRRRRELEREKQLLLKAIKETEFDHEMRKISDGDFAEIAGRYRRRALEVMRQLDETAGDYRKLVERDLADRVRDRVREGGAVAAAAAAPPAPAPAPSRWQCPACDTGNDADALFCKRCGRCHQLSEAH